MACSELTVDMLFRHDSYPPSGRKVRFDRVHKRRLLRVWRSHGPQGNSFNFLTKLFFAHGYPLYGTLWLVKVSLIALYARICWNTFRVFRWVTYITLAILAVSVVIVLLYKTFFCWPLVSYLRVLIKVTSLGSYRSMYGRFYYAVLAKGLSECHSGARYFDRPTMSRFAVLYLEIHPS
jgi:hypothetical protein